MDMSYDFKNKGMLGVWYLSSHPLQGLVYDPCSIKLSASKMHDGGRGSKQASFLLEWFIMIE